MLCSPSRTSATPVNPACTIVAAATPLRAPMPAKSNAFSMWSSSRVQLQRPDTCCARVRQREAHAALVEPGQRRRGRRRAERGARAFGAAMRGAHVVGAERQQEAAAHVVAERHGAQQLGAGPAVPLGHGERGRHDGAAGMRLGHRLEVVGLVGVGEHAVGERGVDGGGAQIRGQHGRLRRAALRPDVADRGDDPAAARARDDGRERCRGSGALASCTTCAGSSRSRAETM